MDPRFACIDCGGRSSSPGRCPSCGQEPLLDLQDREVRLALAEEDRRRRSAQDSRMVLVSVGVVVPTGLVLAFVPGFWTLLSLVSAPPVLTFVLTLSAGAFGLSRVLLRLFPAKTRFSDLADGAQGTAVR